MQMQVSKQQQRTSGTRQSILDAAVQLYLARGVEKTTVSDIIAASGVGRTTFYRYFNDQDEVLGQALLRDFDAMMEAFNAQRFEHDSLEAQILEDMIWFIRQLSTRPALSLLFDRKNSRKGRFMPAIKATLQAFRKAGMTCAEPTYQRAEREGRLREGVSLPKYVDWVTFVITSLETADTPFRGDEFKLRDMLRCFLIPSLISDGRRASTG